MSAGAADRRNPSAGETLRLSAVTLADERSTIGRYKILSELGQGAMGTVYLALDPNINRKVALKVLQPRGVLNAVDMEDLRARFLLEARAAGSLRHPSAVAIYDADHDPESGLSYIAMEWVDGQSLDRVIKESGPLPIEQAISIVTQVASALDAAHRQGLIHRDVKPANILLDQEGNAKLSDFGIAKLESLELTSTGQVLGTPYYMSPEQIRDQPLDGRSDQFSLGVVFYQCVTGEMPFKADSLPALTHKILHVHPRPPAELNREVPDSVASAIDKALQKDPEARFATLAELAEALGTQIGLLTTTVDLSRTGMARTTLSGADQSWQRRTWGLTGVVLFVLTLIALIGANWKSESLEQSQDHRQPATVPRAETPVSPTVAEPAPEQVPTVGTATLEISYTNRLKHAVLEVWVDGEQVVARTMSRPRGLIRRATGKKILETLEVSPGHHDVKVSVRGVEGKIEASNWTGARFAEGEIRRLRVEIIPPKYLKLSWKDT